MMNDTWERREFPVLRTIVEISDEGARDMDARDVARHAGFDLGTTLVALFALAGEDQPLFKYEDASDFDGRDMCLIREPSRHARRTVGTWPKPEDQVDQLIEALRLAAEREPDQEQKSALRKSAAYAAGAGRDLFIGIVSGAVTGG
jgi:hypothetical protein